MPPEFDDVDSAVLFRFVSGDSPDDEMDRVRRWAASAPANAAELDRLRSAWALTGADMLPPVGSTKAVWRRITAQLPASPARELRLVAFPPRGRPRRGFAITLAVAAVLVAAAGLATRAREHRAEQKAPAMREVVTKRGERAQLRLADGTSIVLGPATVLKLPATFDERTRNVYLDGQGYFDVAHDPAHPFTVITAGGHAQARGTRFSVRAYLGDSAVEVVVAEGVVALGAGSGDVPLRPGDVGRLDRAGRTGVGHVPSLDAALAWTTGVLHFDNVLLRDAVPSLERQYNLVIHVSGAALPARRFTATFTDRNVGEALDGVAFLLGAHYTRAGDTVTFAGGRK